MTTDEKTRNGLVTKLMRKLQARARLAQLLADATPLNERPELVRLRDYLVQWAMWERSQFEKLGAGVSDPLAHQPTAASTASDYLERSDRMVMDAIEAAVEDLRQAEDGKRLCAALRLRYLQEGISREAGQPIRVLSNNRLAGLSIEAVDRLADQAEEMMVVLVRRHKIEL